MTLGQKIKKARTAAGLTQKDLADQLSVSFQTVSKWEGDTNEPDIMTLKAIAKALGVTVEYLISEEDEEPKPQSEEPPIEPAPITVPVPEKRQIGTCPDCHSPIMEGDIFHNVERKSPSGVKETVMVCDSCFRKHEEEMERRAREIEQSMAPKPKVGTGPFHKITDRNDKKPLIWSIVLGVIALIITLIACIVNYSMVGIGWTIGAPLLIGYAVMATIYCIFTASYVSDIFMAVAGWSIRFPGLIFTWDLEGFMWLIAMKLLFFVLGILIGIGTFLLAVGLSAVFSIFTFIPLLIYNKTHY